MRFRDFVEETKDAVHAIAGGLAGGRPLTPMLHFESGDNGVQIQAVDHRFFVSPGGRQRLIEGFVIPLVREHRADKVAWTFTADVTDERGTLRGGRRRVHRRRTPRGVGRASAPPARRTAVRGRLAPFAARHHGRPTTHSTDPGGHAMTADLTAEALTATLVQMEYPRDEIRAAVVKRFPGADVDAIIDAEQERKDKIDRELADAQSANEHTTDG